MTKNLVSFTLALLLTIASIGAQTAKRDTKEAGQDVKDAGKSTVGAAKQAGSATKEDQQEGRPNVCEKG